ncbi:hypothetical protein Pmani_035639, partial [Petrolisthes manimaculis]
SLLDEVVEVEEVTGGGGGGDKVTITTLTLPHLTRQHLRRTLTCLATSLANLTTPLTADVTLDMTFPPLEVLLKGPHTELREGTQHYLGCESRGSLPPADLFFYLNGDLLTSNMTEVMKEGNVSRATLLLVPGRELDGASLTCRAQNPTFPAATALEDTRILQVYYSPRVKVVVGRRLQLHNIKQGEDVYFECLIQANPAAHKVSWALNGETLHSNKSVGVIQSNQSLVLQGVGRASSGAYQCHAYNTMGTSTSLPLHLRVKFAPVCSTGQKWVYGSSLAHAVNVTCSVESYPPAGDFQWVFNTSTEYAHLPSELVTTYNTVAEEEGEQRDSLSMEEEGGSQTMEEGGGGGWSMVTYTPQTHHDFGSLLCWARNEVDRQRKPCVFHVVPAGVPEPVENCSAWEGGGGEAGRVVVWCQPGWGGGLDQTFTLEVREGSSGARKDSLRASESSLLPEEDTLRSEEGSIKAIDGSSEGYLRPAGTEGGGGGEGRVLARLRNQPEPHFTVAGLKAGQEYLLSIVASNSQGAAPPTFLVHHTPIDVAEQRTSPVVSPGSWPPHHLGALTAPIVGAAVGIATSLLLCALAIVFIVRRRIRRRSPHAHSHTLGHAQSVAYKKTKGKEAECEAPDVILVRGAGGGGGGGGGTEVKEKEEEEEEERKTRGGRGKGDDGGTTPTRYSSYSPTRELQNGAECC